ncbi:hypothetical protein [Bradyrhizobium sp.]|uniref:hypothetical protein n=1 Tax=Bradyrhizobium sp. TaxID=376 RepID=UPI003C6EC8B3
MTLRLLRYSCAARTAIHADGTIAQGFGAQATGVNSIAIGTGAIAAGSIAMGNTASASNGGAAFGDSPTRAAEAASPTSRPRPRSAIRQAPPP